MAATLDEWLLACHFHQTFEREAAALTAHGLFAPVLEFRCVDGTELSPQLVDVDNSALFRAPFVPESFESIAEFATSNAAYLSSLKEYVEKHFGGLPGSIGVSES